MKKYLFVFVFMIVGGAAAWAQNFAEQTKHHRDKYKAEFLSSSNSPLKKEHLTYLRFYEADSTFAVNANFERTTDATPFEMPTYSGKKKNFVKYGVLRFNIAGNPQTLSVYRNLDLAALPQYRNYLFIPFRDKTSGSETYGGGRYLDVKTTDVKDGILALDFNKAYNPYCAYSEGYNCPIPPKENLLLIPITAGEKNFAKEH